MSVSSSPPLECDTSGLDRGKGYGKGKSKAPPPPPCHPHAKAKIKGHTQEVDGQVSAARKAARTRLNQRIEALEKNHMEQEEYVRSTTQIKGPESEKLREDYKHEDEMFNWYPAVQDFTFQTEFLPLESKEKCAILYEFFNGVSRHWEWHAFPPNNAKLQDLFQEFWSEFGTKSEAETTGNILDALDGRIDEILRQKFKEHGAFVKLYTSSPKDAPSNFSKAKASYQAKATMDSMSDDQRWILFYMESIRANRVIKGSDVVSLLVSSKKVAIDLMADLQDLQSHAQCGGSGLGLAIRAYDEAVTPAHEFRGFVWDGELTAVTQTLCFVVEEVLQNECCIKAELEYFFKNKVKPRIYPEAGIFGERLREARQLPRHFTMDLLWDPTKPFQEQVTLIEINPFEGEDWSVYTDSTGLYTLKSSWELEEPVQISSQVGQSGHTAVIDVLKWPVQNKYRDDFNIVFGFRDFATRVRRQPDDRDFIDLRLMRQSKSREEIFAAYLGTHPDWLRLIYGDLVFEEKLPSSEGAK